MGRLTREARHEQAVRAIMEDRVTVWLAKKLAARVHAVLSVSLTPAEVRTALKVRRQGAQRTSRRRLRTQHQADAAFRSTWQHLADASTAPDKGSR